MPLRIPVVWSDDHRLHEPAGEIWVGVRTAGTEVAARADVIRAALVDAGAPVVAAQSHDDAAFLAVHSRELLDFLAGAWASWEEAGLPVDPGQDRIVPYIFPVEGLLPSGVAPLEPAAVWARTGFFCFDTMTLIGPGTWEAARAAADAALTAADLVAAGRKAVYACCRPPGHHVSRSAYGGSCYLNNAAITEVLGGDRCVVQVARAAVQRARHVVARRTAKRVGGPGARIERDVGRRQRDIRRSPRCLPRPRPDQRHRVDRKSVV